MELWKEGCWRDDSMHVETIHAIHYFEWPSGYFFEGETHDFWELMYVDKGKLIVHSGIREYCLEQGKMIFHRPMQFHDVRAAGKDAPNIIVIAFSCYSPAMAILGDKCFATTKREKELLVSVISEAQGFFYYGENDPYLIRVVQIPFGALQVVRMGLEHLLIEIVRNEESGRVESTLSETSLRDTKARMETDAIIEFLNQNLDKRLSLDDICRKFFLSRSYLQAIFKKHTDTSIMEYYSNLRIQKAKELIREGTMNFTEIAEYLKYSSIYHFSRRFKEHTGMSPSEYAASIKDWI